MKMPNARYWENVPALVETATVENWTRPLAGAADVIEGALTTSRRIPDGLLRDALSLREPRFLAAVLKNEQLISDPAALDRIVELALAADVGPFVETLLSSGAAARADVRERLAETGHPEVVKQAHARHEPWSWRLRRKVIAAAGREDLSPAFNHAQQVLESGGPERVAEQLNALLTFHDHTKGMERLERVDAGPLPPEVAGVLRAVLETGDAGVLRAAVERAEGTEGLLAELYDGKTPGDPLCFLEWREPLDWAALTAAARRKPFVKEAAAAVTAHPECPDELRLLLYARHPVAVAENAAHLDVDMLKTDCPKRSRPKAMRTLIWRGLGREISGAVFAAEGAPAVSVLEGIRTGREEHGPSVQEFMKWLTGLVEEHLGDDVGAWRSARALLNEFPGTIGELLAKAAASPLDGEWPEAAEYPENSSPSSLTAARAAFVTLLDAASDSTHAILVPHFDARTTHDLYRFCAWRPAWPEQALATAPKGAVAPAWILSGRPGLEAEAIEQLMSSADPDVLFLLFWHAGCTDDQRARIMAVATDRLMQHPTEWAKSRGQPHLTGWPPYAQGWRLADLYACTDHDLFKRILHSVYVLGRIPQLRVFLHVWRTWGAEVVAGMLEKEPVTYSTYDKSREVIKDLLERSALAELEAQVAEGTTAQAQIAMWRTRRDRAAMIKEIHQWHWAELLAEHRREPFHNDIIGLLLRLPDSPEAFRREGETVLLTFEATQYRQLMSGIPPEKVLAECELGPYAFDWLIPSMKCGRVTWAQALEHAFPADNVLRLLGQHGQDGGGYETLTALMHDTIKDSPDAWLLAVGMLPGFTGSVADLLRTAGVAAG